MHKSQSGYAGGEGFGCNLVAYGCQFQLNFIGKCTKTWKNSCFGLCNLLNLQLLHSGWFDNHGRASAFGLSLMYCMMDLFRKQEWRLTGSGGVFWSSMFQAWWALPPRDVQRWSLTLLLLFWYLFCTNYVLQGFICCVFNDTFAVSYGWRVVVNWGLFRTIVLMHVICLIDAVSMSR